MLIPAISSDFDLVLAAISDILADARRLEQQGAECRAAILYAMAERYALRTGFLELLNLVWAYDAATRL